MPGSTKSTGNFISGQNRYLLRQEECNTLLSRVVYKGCPIRVGMRDWSAAYCSYCMPSEHILLGSVSQGHIVPCAYGLPYGLGRWTSRGDLPHTLSLRDIQCLSQVFNSVFIV